MNSDTLSAVELWKKITEKAFELDYTESKDCPFVPWLLIQADYVEGDISDYFLSIGHMFDSYYSLQTAAASWCAYMGLGSVVCWEEDKQTLQLNGILWALTSENGFEGVDKYVAELTGMTKEEFKKFSSEIFDLWQYALFLAFSSPKNSQSKQIAECFKALYLYGMSYEMKRLGNIL